MGASLVQRCESSTTVCAPDRGCYRYRYRYRKRFRSRFDTDTDSDSDTDPERTTRLQTVSGLPQPSTREEKSFAIGINRPETNRRRVAATGGGREPAVELTRTSLQRIAASRLRLLYYESPSGRGLG
jgi:hypothetical protein